jgi:hypothetical protein
MATIEDFDKQMKRVSEFQIIHYSINQLQYQKTKTWSIELDKNGVFLNIVAQCIPALTIIDFMIKNDVKTLSTFELDCEIDERKKIRIYTLRRI